MRRAFYFLRSYKYDFVAAFPAIISVVVFYYTQNRQFLFLLSLVFIFISLIAIIYLRFREKDFYFIPLTNRKDKDDWIGRGMFEYSRVKKCFQITDSDSGYIYSRCLIWSDYQYRFEFKIIQSCIGVVLRAINLSNYVMLQIGQDGVRPHIRINGGWKVWEHKDVGLSFDKILSLDKWYKCFLSCEKDSIAIRLYDGVNIIFDREWGIPGGQIGFVFTKEEQNAKPLIIPFPINLEYGSVGFRNFGSEKALMRNVLVEKI